MGILIAIHAPVWQNDKLYLTFCQMDNVLEFLEQEGGWLPKVIFLKVAI